jgi:hypothetical protein
MTDALRGGPGARLIQVLIPALLLLGGAVEAVDVTATMGVLAYTLATSCPRGWDDLSRSDPYRGRLIKGWNPVIVADPPNDIGETSAEAASTTNEAVSHTHTLFAFRSRVTSAPIGKPGVTGAGITSTHFVASDQSFTSDAMGTFNSVGAKIPREPEAIRYVVNAD